jgi:hypothetical protein
VTAAWLLLMSASVDVMLQLCACVLRYAARAGHETAGICVNSILVRGGAYTNRRPTSCCTAAGPADIAMSHRQPRYHLKVSHHTNQLDGRYHTQHHHCISETRLTLKPQQTRPSSIAKLSRLFLHPCSNSSHWI